MLVQIKEVKILHLKIHASFKSMLTAFILLGFSLDNECFLMQADLLSFPNS